MSQAAAAEFHERMGARAAAALESAGVKEHWLSVAGEAVRLRFAGESLERLLMPAIEHLKNGAGGEAALTVTLFDTKSTGEAPVPPPWAAEAQGPRGVIEGYNSERFRTVYQPGSDVLLLYDAERRSGLYWTPDHARVPFWETSFPLRSMMQWWLAGRGLQLAHAAAVGLPEGGVLITGPSGSGKSTTAVACLESELRYAGDDFVLLGRAPLRAHCLYSTAKLTREAEGWFPRLAAAVSNRERSEDEKALLFVQQWAPGKLIEGFPIKALLVPKVTGQRETRLVRCGGGEALRALAPTTLFQLPGTGPASFELLGAIVREAPAYRLELGTEMAGIPRAILKLLRGEERA